MYCPRLARRGRSAAEIHARRTCGLRARAHPWRYYRSRSARVGTVNRLTKTSFLIRRIARYETLYQSLRIVEIRSRASSRETAYITNERTSHCHVDWPLIFCPASPSPPLGLITRQSNCGVPRPFQGCQSPGTTRYQRDSEKYQFEVRRNYQSATGRRKDHCSETDVRDVRCIVGPAFRGGH